MQKDDFEKNHRIDSLNNFEKIIKEICKNMLEQNVLDAKQMIEDDLRLFSIAPIESFLLLRLFCDKYVKNNNFPTLFFGHPRQCFQCSYKKIIQLELTNVN